MGSQIGELPWEFMVDLEKGTDLEDVETNFTEFLQIHTLSYYQIYMCFFRKSWPVAKTWLSPCLVWFYVFLCCSPRFTAFIVIEPVRFHENEWPEISPVNLRILRLMMQSFFLSLLAVYATRISMTLSKFGSRMKRCTGMKARHSKSPTKTPESGTGNVGFAFFFGGIWRKATLDWDSMTIAPWHGSDGQKESTCSMHHISLFCKDQFFTCAWTSF